MTTDVSPLLVRHQGRNIYQFLAQGLQSVVPLNRARDVQTPTDWLRETLPPVPAELAERYALWCGAPADRYAGVVPPHMVSYWGLALLAKVAGQAPYNLLTVLNQGCRVQTRQPLPLDEPIQAAGRLANIQNDGRRIRIAVEIRAGTKSVPDAQTIESMVTVPIKGAAKKGGENRQEPAFDTVGRWSAGAYDGVKFALLTGDFNPIHTLWPLARRTRHRGCILHGFGSLTRSYETIQNHGITIGDFDVRFVKPLRLPATDLEVQVSRDEIEPGQYAMRLCGTDGAVHLAGRFTKAEKEAA